jgi:hypothetical protein
VNQPAASQLGETQRQFQHHSAQMAAMAIMMG